MARFWNRWIGHSHSANRTASSTPEGRKRRPTRRRLKSEALEARQLLAANFLHNELMPEDVNEDGVVSALDALTIINRMGRQAQSDINDIGAPPARGPGQLTDVNNDGRDSALDALMVINRLGRQQNEFGSPTQPPGPQDGPDRPGHPPKDDSTGDDSTSDSAAEVQSIDGSGNNLENPEFGAAGTELLRIAANDYADGISSPAGEDRPSARAISNLLSGVETEDGTSQRKLTSFIFAWGQFLDHDITLSLEPDNEEDSESLDIAVPEGDVYFDPSGTGEATIHLTRSAVASGTGTSADNPAEQENAITAWVDGSQVYGSDQATSDSLREFIGGRLLISKDGLLPTDENGGILAGDIRAAENVVLTSMHALFVREHNRLADSIAAENPDLDDEQVFQRARALVIAELQSITYNEYLPALLGEGALSNYTGYDSSVDPGIANELSTGAFRHGHSTLNDEFRLVGNDGEDVDEPISLAAAFFVPGMLEETGIDAFLKYGASTLSQEIDLQVVDSLRNFLFGPPGAGGFDLVSLNIQRGRDHGLADYNATREAYGLDRVESFAEITSDESLQAKLETLYGDVNNIDLWVGLMAEDHTANGSLGETSTAIIADQFERLRDGDRFYYENTMSDREVSELERTSFADIIQRNTNIDSLQSNVFFFSPTITGSVVVESSTRQLAEGTEMVSLSNGDADDLRTDRQDDPERDGAPRRDGETRPSHEGQPQGAEGIAIELVDSAGNVVDSVLTDARGNYAFDSVTQSGGYQVRVAESDQWDVSGADTWDLSISNGEERMKHIDFRVVV